MNTAFIIPRFITRSLLLQAPNRPTSYQSSSNRRRSITAHRLICTRSFSDPNRAQIRSHREPIIRYCKAVLQFLRSRTLKRVRAVIHVPNTWIRSFQRDPRSHYHERRRRSTFHTELCVNSLQMLLHGTWTHPQHLRQFVGGLSIRQQAQDLLLALCKARQCVFHWSERLRPALVACSVRSSKSS